MSRDLFYIGTHPACRTRRHPTVSRNLRLSPCMIFRRRAKTDKVKCVSNTTIYCRSLSLPCRRFAKFCSLEYKIGRSKCSKSSFIRSIRHKRPPRSNIRFFVSWMTLFDWNKAPETVFFTEYTNTRFRRLSKVLKIRDSCSFQSKF